MNSKPQIPGEDRLVAEMVALDEALAAGKTPQQGATTKLQPAWERCDVACLKRLQNLRPSRAQGDTSTRHRALGMARNDADQPLPETQIGRFRLKKELGRGGFGVVFLAHDPQLQREVALKVPRVTALVNDELRQRFHQEACAAAGLDHPNIVQVYEAGESGPVCYIASAYCAGMTLAEWLRQRTEPVPFATAAELIATLAEAVDHAHQRHVLHRDLKPGNVLIQVASSQWPVISEINSTPVTDQETLPNVVPKITDFGLAKMIDAPGAPTQTGSFLGTPSYMAPEQASGKTHEYSPVTDIYALGTILYELLTGRPPFRGESDLDTLHQVQCDEPLAPHKLRKRVPKDLETICLKCLQKEPHRRYTTAALLAADLHHYLAAEPIQARPVGLSGRVYRWCRRKPLVAGLGIALVTALLTGIAGVVWQWQETLWEKAGALQARSQAENRFKTLLETVDRLTRLGQELLDDPRTEAKGRAILLETLTYYQQFLKEKSDDPDIQLEVAKAYVRVSSIQNTLLQRAEAYASLQQAEAIYDRLAAKRPQSGEYREGLGDIYFQKGRLCRLRERYPQGAHDCEIAIKQFRVLAQEHPKNHEYRAKLGQSLNNFASILGTLKRFDESIRSAEEAVLLLTELLHEDPASVSHAIDLAQSQDILGSVLWFQGNPQQGAKELRKGAQLLEALLSDHPANVNLLAQLGYCHSHLGRVQDALKELDEAIRSYEQAERYLVEAVKLKPHNSDTQYELAAALSYGTVILARIPRIQQCMEFKARMDAAWQMLAQTFPVQYGYKSIHARFCNRLAGTLRKAKHPELAAKAYVQAITLCEQEIQQRPNLSKKQLLAGLNLQAKCCLDWGEAQLNDGLARDALATFDRILQIQQQLIKEEPRNIQHARDAASTYLRLATIASSIPDYKRAEEAYAQASTRIGALRVDNPREVKLLQQQTNLLSQWTALLAKQGKYQEAERMLHSIFFVQDELINLEPNNLAHTRAKANLHGRLAVLLSKHLKNDCAAMDQYRHALALDNTSALAHNNLAWLLVTARDTELHHPAEALKHAQQAVVLEPKNKNYWHTLCVATCQYFGLHQVCPSLYKAIELSGN